MFNEINGCLFLGKQGLFKMFCAFEVLCIQDVKHIKQGDYVLVTAVKTTSEGAIVYEIERDYFYHYYFVLLMTP
jgi:hypothetical protein